MAESAGDILLINHETGDLTEWTSETSESGNDVVIESSTVLHGSYSGKCSFGGTAGSNICIVTRTFTAADEVYVRGYFRIPSGFSSSGNTGLMYLFTDASNFACYLRLTSGLAADRFYYRTDSGSAYVFPTAFTFSVDTTYYVEYHFKRSSGANDGVAELKINGTSYANVTGIDNDTVTVGRVIIGNYEAGVPTNGSAIIFDDVKLNNATSGYPGAYAEAGGSTPKGVFGRPIIGCFGGMI